MAERRNLAAVGLRPARTPSDCWDWISAEDVMRLALQAWLAAQRKTSEPPDPEFFDPQCPEDWYSRQVFAEDLAELFRLRIGRAAQQVGVPGFENYAGRLALLEAPVAPPANRVSGS